MASSLPGRASLAALRKQARRLQRAVRADQPDALDWVRTHHPDPTPVLADSSRFPLSAAQTTVARAYGFPSWPGLVAYLDRAPALAWDPGRIDETGLSAADRFCVLACLRYDERDDPARRDEAGRLLAAHPELVTTHIWAAAAAGDAAAIRTHLAADPALATAHGGPDGFDPLLQLCYSRVHLGRSEAEILASAAMLLDAGADPNAGRLWQGLTPPFTALAGVLGEGEQGAGRQPPHPYAVPLARQLLTRGADPTDGQALYNRMFRRGTGHLELLFEFGLGQGAGGPWRARLGPAIETVQDSMRRQLDWAARHGMTDRLDLLARHGWTTDAEITEDFSRANPSWPNQVVDGRTALHDAAFAGDLDLIQDLLAAGADPCIRDAVHGSTALGWAEWAHQDAAAATLREVTPPD